MSVDLFSTNHWIHSLKYFSFAGADLLNSCNCTSLYGLLRILEHLCKFIRHIQSHMPYNSALIVCGLCGFLQISEHLRNYPRSPISITICQCVTSVGTTLRRKLKCCSFSAFKILDRKRNSSNPEIGHNGQFTIEK